MYNYFMYRNHFSVLIASHYMQADTARVLWAYHSSDPVSESIIPRHEAKGSASLNLLGGLTVDRVEPDAADFTVLISNVSST